MESQGTRIADSIFEGGEQNGGLTLLNFKIYYKARVIKAVW